MGTFLRGADTAYALRFLRLLTMPWTKTEAFKVGVIDEKGKKLKKPDTKEEREAYTIFHRLVFNMRRLIQKVPGGTSSLASYLAAFWLIREDHWFDEETLLEAMAKLNIDVDKAPLLESAWEIGDTLMAGSYVIKNTVILPGVDGYFAEEGSFAFVGPGTKAHRNKIFGRNVYCIEHETGRKIYVLAEMIAMIDEDGNVSSAAVIGDTDGVRASKDSDEL